MVSVGQDHSCALKTDGRAFCWGSNASGQLGVAASDTVCGVAKRPCVLVPRAVETDLRFRQIAAGGQHTCAIALDRTAWCWGDNSYGQLGAAVAGGPSLVTIGASLGWSDISAGLTHSCAVRTDGAGYCWGRNDRGQLGTGDTIPQFTPVRTARRLTLASISAGMGRTCARTVQSAPYCWGADWLYNSGGFDYTEAQPFPSAVPFAPSMVAVTVGAFTTCGLDVLGVAYCWEANAHGTIGNGSTEGSTIPRQVSGGLQFVAVSSGLIQTCGIAVTGAGYCWGDDSFGQLGESPRNLVDRCGGQYLPCATRPIPVYGRQHFVSISTGLGSHSCGVTTLGNLYCWGLGVSGQLGEGILRVAEVVPMLVR